MTRAPTTESDILKTLPERAEQARRLLADIARKLVDARVVDGDSKWAIVGGAVRDALLQHPRIQRLFLSVPDIDVAVTARRRFQLTVNRLTAAGAEASVNTFGGWKLRLADIGPMDVWSWGRPLQYEGATEFWVRRLARVDFGLNAVAFIWPEQQLVIHPRWTEDVLHRSVEKLNLESPARELQVVRAISLLVKVQHVLGGTVKLGPGIRADLSWLLKNASPNELNRALTYLQHKTETRRWPRTTVRRFIGRYRHYKCRKDVEEAIGALLGERPHRL